MPFDPDAAGEALAQVRELEDRARQARDAGKEDDALPLWQEAMKLRKKYGLIEQPPAEAWEDD